MPHIVKSYDDELNNLRSDIIKMSDESVILMEKGFEAFINNDRKLAKKVSEDDQKINALNDKITLDATEIIALRQPMAYDLRLLTTCFKISNNLERIGDVAKGFSKKMDLMEEYKIENNIVTELKDMLDSVKLMQKKIIICFKNKNLDRIEEVYKMDKAVDQRYREMFSYLIREYPKSHPNSYGTLIKIAMVLKGIERIGDHITNIADGIYYIFKVNSVET